MSNSVKKESGLFPVSAKEVEDKIVVIRGMPVIADADVAVLYGVETKRVNGAVKNNPDKFPLHYAFELDINETFVDEIFVRKYRNSLISNSNA